MIQSHKVSPGGRWGESYKNKTVSPQRYRLERVGTEGSVVPVARFNVRVKATLADREITVAFAGRAPQPVNDVCTEK